MDPVAPLAPSVTSRSEQQVPLSTTRTSVREPHAPSTVSSGTSKSTAYHPRPHRSLGDSLAPARRSSRRRNTADSGGVPRPASTAAARAAHVDKPRARTASDRTIGELDPREGPDATDRPVGADLSGFQATSLRSAQQRPTSQSSLAAAYPIYPATNPYPYEMRPSHYAQAPEPNASPHSRSRSGTLGPPLAVPSLSLDQVYAPPHLAYPGHHPVSQQLAPHHSQHHPPPPQLHHQPPHPQAHQHVLAGQPSAPYMSYSGQFYQHAPTASQLTTSPTSHSYGHALRLQGPDMPGSYMAAGQAEQAGNSGSGSDVDSTRPDTSRSNSMSSSTMGEISAAAMGSGYVHQFQAVSLDGFATVAPFSNEWVWVGFEAVDPQCPYGYCLDPMIRQYPQYASFYTPAATTPPVSYAHQSHANDAGGPMLQSPGPHSYGMQPVPAYGRFAYGAVPPQASYAPQCFAPVYMTGRPNWQHVQSNHFHQLPQAPPPGGPPASLPWRPGLGSSNNSKSKSNSSSNSSGSAGGGAGAAYYAVGRSAPGQRHRNVNAQWHAEVRPSYRGANAPLLRPPALGEAAMPSPILDGVPAGVAEALSSGTSAGSDTMQQTRTNVPHARTKSGTTAAPEAHDATAGPPAAVDEGNPTSVKASGRSSRFHQQQGPRSEFVLWCGNVPHDATVEELWNLFTQLPPEQDGSDEDGAEAGQGSLKAKPPDSPRSSDKPDVSFAEASGLSDSATQTDPGVDVHGVLSVFVISRSNCAFINYATAQHVERATRYFQGKSLRPSDPRCPRLVCRVRKKDDEAQAGVLGQRGRGVHVSWLKQQRAAERRKRSIDSKLATTISAPTWTASLAATDVTLSPSLTPASVSSERTGASLPEPSSSSYSSSGSISFASTNSSLFRHPAFRNRFFILKSLRREDLERSVTTGLWATQPHNEAVLDQAFRNSENVYLIFSVNESGEFFGYAKMAGPIHARMPVKREVDVGTVSVESAQSTPPGVGSRCTAAAPLPPPAYEANGTETGAEPSAADAAVASLAPITARALHVSPQTHTRELPPPFSSPLPLTPSQEQDKRLEAAFAEDEGLQTPRNDTTFYSSHSQTWPATTKPNVSTVAEASSDQNVSGSLQYSPETSTCDPPPSRPAFQQRQTEPDDQGVRRMDMYHALSPPQAASEDHSVSLAPSDSASWSSAESRFAEQAALRAVIHNLRLDERESRGKANMLEHQLNASTDQAGRWPRLPSNDDLRSSTEGWGKPFKIEWIKVKPLSFYRVRKLRNPWRDNRLVKVSRDGTELEPGVGTKILAEWDKDERALSPCDRRGKKHNGDRAKASTAGDITEEDE
ncbi:hypothetical protein ACQY0O_008377 [Thecaphora frezii]